MVLAVCLVLRRDLVSIRSINLSSHLAYKLLALLVLVNQPPYIRLHFALQEFPPLNLFCHFLHLLLHLAHPAVFGQYFLFDLLDGLLVPPLFLLEHELLLLECSLSDAGDQVLLKLVALDAAFRGSILRAGSAVLQLLLLKNRVQLVADLDVVLKVAL